MRHFTKDVEGYRICLLITGYGEAATQDKLIRACHQIKKQWMDGTQFRGQYGTQ